MPTEQTKPHPTSGERHFDLVISNARLIDNDGLVNVAIADSAVDHIGSGPPPPAAEVIDAAGGLITPSFVDPHFHLDKVLTREMFGAERFEDAFARAHEVKARFTLDDVAARVATALELAVASGLGAIRAQVDVDYATGLVSLQGVLTAADRFRDLIDVQVVAFPQEGVVDDPASPAILRDALAMGAHLIGGLPELERSGVNEDAHIEAVFDLAEEHGIELDLHADYTDRVECKTLEKIADQTIARGMQGRVTAGHCCALAVYDDDEAKRVIDKVAAAQIQVSVLPIANLQMLGGSERTPRNRGSSRILELLDAGINVAAGADNMFDIWYRFNAMDPVLTGLMTCLSGGMRTDAEVAEALNMVTTRASRVLGRYDGPIGPGAPADMVIHSAGTIEELFRMLPGKRTTIRRGIPVGSISTSASVAGQAVDLP